VGGIQTIVLKISGTPIKNAVTWATRSLRVAYPWQYVDDCSTVCYYLKYKSNGIIKYLNSLYYI
jgi:hypothetical protein